MSGATARAAGPKGRGLRILRPALAALAVLLGVEGLELVREWASTGAPTARGLVAAEEVKAEPKPASGEKAARTATATTQAAPAQPLSDSEIQLLKTLEKRKQALDQQDKELKRREERVRLAEKSLDVKMVELKKLRDEIAALYEEEKKSRDDRLKMMVQSICINMKPDQSAAILANMDDEIVLKMFTMVPDKQLSRILEKMDRKKAAELSAAYVKQKKTLPKPPEK